jgi:hypothetical protein
MIPPIICDDFPKDYFQVIKCPVDFTTISASLAAQKYKTVSEWCRAIDLVFDNTKRYYQDGPMVQLGQAMEAVFNKAYAKEFGVPTLKDWCDRLRTLRDRVGLLSSSPPQLPMCDIAFKKELSTQLPTANEMKTLIEDAAKLTKPEDHEKLLALLKKAEPEKSFGTEKISLDVLSLKPSTIRLADAFIRERLVAEGIEV